jgi:hypothetical protein
MGDDFNPNVTVYFPTSAVVSSILVQGSILENNIYV